METLRSIPFPLPDSSISSPETPHGQSPLQSPAFTGARAVAMSSTSKIFAATEGGHHLLRLENYSSTKSAFLNGQGVKSHPFSIGGHRWSIRFYPNGINAFCPRYVSLYLVLEESVAS
ncbi:hypothetical protein ACQ4PT_058665 [Festuca glaucescens]